MDPASIAAPLLLGYMLNWGLYGVLSVQVYLYWTAFPNDQLLTQILVYGLYILETAQTVSLTHNSFQTFVFGFEDPASLTKIHNLWIDTYFFDTLVALIFQVYFANRIHNLLSRAKILPGIILLLALAQFCGGVGTSIILKKVGSFDTSGQLVTPVPGILWIGCGTLADVLIAVTMVYALSRYDTTFKRTKSLVKRLSQLALETGSLIAAMILVQPILFFSCPGKTYHMAPALVIAKLYSNSLLVIFNSRIQIIGARGTRTTINVTPTPHQNQETPIPLSDLRTDSSGTSSWVPSSFPSTLDDNSYGLTNTLDSKMDTSRIASEPQIAGLDSRDEYHSSDSSKLRV
uniref:DUF6534 domain-containing protein n=1 Tax=Moniliophthora roreri TaxID=221103 RepID=A0A0W0G0L4_MONRR